ncbi:MAG: putative dTDP-4-dehydrorhamnose reductase [Verrucomicrobiales bacterium]|nr:putative dTDP-4-dehydrorhamnose reductase [Verrucomicrobiales bacterium]
MAIWITGTHGLIGSHVLRRLEAEGIDAFGVSRGELDLGDFQAVEKFFSEKKPAGIIHCAAMSKATECDRDTRLARHINIDLTQLLSELAANIPFTFLSTDLVFDGTQGNYSEKDSPAPLNYYGETKVKAEESVLKNLKHTVIRTSLNAGISPTGDRAFNEEMKKMCGAGKSVKLFTDEFRSPIPVVETAALLVSLYRKSERGLYHLAGAETLSRMQIGLALLDKWDLPPSLAAGSSLHYYQGPRRAANTTLNCGKLEKLLGRRMPGFTEWLGKATPEQI